MQAFVHPANQGLSSKWKRRSRRVPSNRLDGLYYDPSHRGPWSPNRPLCCDLPLVHAGSIRPPMRLAMYACPTRLTLKASTHSSWENVAPPQRSRQHSTTCTMWLMSWSVCRAAFGMGVKLLAVGAGRASTCRVARLKHISQRVPSSNGDSTD
jgi:hypothetical protein